VQVDRAAYPDDKKADLHLPAIDGLRGLAVLGVVWHHLTFDKLDPSAATSLSHIADYLPFVSNGWQGVNLFFFLSGFVLALPYISGKRRFQTRADVLAFYAHRAKRLLPLFYFVCIFSFVLLSPVYDLKSTLKFLATCSLLFTFHPSTFVPAVNWVFWSLGVEIWFSILFPFALMLFVRSRWAMVAGVIVVSLAVRIVGQEIFRLDHFVQNPISDSVLGRLDDFALGITACYLFVFRQDKLAGSARVLMAAGAVLVLIAMLLWNKWLTHAVPGFSAAFWASLMNVGLLLFVAGLLARRTVLHALLENRVIVTIGIMCYSIYAWHGLIIAHVLGHDPWQGSIVEALLRFAILLLGLAAVSLLSFVFIEFPGRGFATLRNHLRGTRKASGS